ncbi:MAG TPA: DMT family transporter [Actinomycetes bacterium]
MTRRAGVVLALVAAVVSGVAVFINTYGVKAVGDATVYTTAKNLVAALLLGAVFAVSVGRREPSARRAPRTPLTRAQLAGLVAMGIGGSVPFVLFFEGLLRASSVHAAFLHKTLVLWVALLAVPLLKERLTWAHGVAIGLLLVGQTVLVGGVTESFGPGEAMILAATMLWALETVLAKWLLGGMSSWTVGVTRMGLGSLVLLAWVGVTGRFGALVALDAAQWGWVLLTGAVLATYVGLWLAALARAQAVDVTAVLVLAAVITAVLAALVNGTTLQPVGLLLVLAGGALAAVRLRPAAGVAVDAGGA